MKRLMIASGLLCLASAPAFAQAEITCGDFSLMNPTQQMETIAELETATSQMTQEEQLTANQIHEKLVADCKDKVDVLVIEVMKGS